MFPIPPACFLAFCIAVPSPQGAGAALDSPGALIEAGHWKRARTLLAPRVQMHPDDPQAVYLLSRVKLAFEDLDGALELAQRAVALEPGNANYHYQLAQVWGEMASRASLFAAARLARKFKNELDAALALDPGNLDALDALMEFSYQAPSLMGGDKNKARSIAEEIFRRNPLRGCFAKAELAREEKDLAGAEVDYLKALETDPQSYDALTELAGFYASSTQKKYALAKKYALRATQLDSTRARGYAILAKSLAGERQWDELDKALAAAAEHVSDNFAPFYEAAGVLNDSGAGLARAEAHLRKYLSQEPEGEEPDLAHAHRLLGLVLEKQGRIAEARSELELAVRLRPHYGEAKKDLQRLDGNR